MFAYTESQFIAVKTKFNKHVKTKTNSYTTISSAVKRHTLHSTRREH
jgi:hypothetical protein